MILSIGNLVTIENPRDGKPYKSRFGLLADIRDLENEVLLADISSTDPNFIYCQCKIDWLVNDVQTEVAHYNATYVREYNV